MSLPATDDFTGADGTSPPNANWTNQDHGVQIKSNACAAPDLVGTQGYAYWNADVFADDQYAFATYLGNPANILGGPSVRASGTNNCYFVDASVPRLFKRVAGALTQIASTSPPFSSGDVAKISVVGTALQYFKNGVQLGTDVTDAALASGSAGVFADSTGATAVALDDWEGGNIEATRRFLLVRH